MESCYFCGSKANIEEHHIVPQRFDGSDKPSNTVDLCHDCHWKLERLYNKEFWETIGVEDPRATKESHITCEYGGCTSPSIGRFHITAHTGSDYVYRCEEHKPGSSGRTGKDGESSDFSKKKEALASRLKYCFSEVIGDRPVRLGEVRDAVRPLQVKDLRYPDGAYNGEKVIIEAIGATFSVELVDGEWEVKRLE